MGRRTPRRLLAALAATAMLAAACSDDGGTTSGTDGGSGASSGGSFSMRIGEPSFLQPLSQCQESECSQVVQTLNTGLLTINPETGEQQLNVAASIESPDNKVWTVTLEEGWKFHNGEPVDADSFLRAWNYAAYGPNAALNGYFFSPVEGFDDVQGEKPKAEEMSGLKAIDAQTIEITLTEPFSQWPYQMSYLPAFAPIAQECLDDLKTCNEEPIGNGPYQIAEPWKHNDSITLERYEDYTGDNVGNADTIEFAIYGDLTTPFKDWQAGQLDITEPDPTQIPQAEALAGDRFLQADDGSFTYLGLPLFLDEFDDLRIRQALSLAIDRDTITEKIYQGTRTPAGDVISPFVPGSRSDACEFCKYDPEEAKRLYDEAGGIPGDTVTIWFNNDGGHETWIQAMGNGWRNVLGLDYKLESQPFTPYLATLEAHKQTGPYRSAWIPDYPSAENYLDPIYGEGEASDTGWSGPAHDEFLDLISQGDSAATPEEGIPAYQEAADVVLEELPVIPLWYGVNTTVYNDTVDNVTYDALQQLLLTEVTVN